MIKCCGLFSECAIHFNNFLTPTETSHFVTASRGLILTTYFSDCGRLSPLRCLTVLTLELPGQDEDNTQRGATGLTERPQSQTSDRED